MAEKTSNSCSKNIHFHQSLALWLLFLYFVFVTPVFADETSEKAAAGTIRVAFSPNSGATKLVTDTIHQAKKQILVHSFTSPAIAKALANAKARGVDVEVILDKS
jgi:phosphatidylserine/phosphatidylglycerophosphate/cardiolipin synthase-like enzyme